VVIIDVYRAFTTAAFCVAAGAREIADGLQLARADIQDRRVRAELREEHRMPAATAGQRQHALSFDRQAGEAVVRIEERAPARDRPGRRALRTRVRDAGRRKPIPHPLVVRGDIVHRDALRRSRHDRAIVCACPIGRASSSRVPSATRP